MLQHIRCCLKWITINPLYEIVLKTMYAKGYSENGYQTLLRPVIWLKENKPILLLAEYRGAFEYVGGNALVILKTEEQFKRLLKKMPKAITL